ncbi:MAG TPA: sigma-70 family RNA polymerase sigma factor [Acidimicrobiales bacterium]|nr:sigma-70 family RNA polymerase sigma factor [Acidimicrobiales bacterium]
MTSPDAHRPNQIDSTRLSLERDIEAHRHQLTAYCYRMLGSIFEAEDAVQETMLRAWRSAATYEGRAPLRSWLYRIATNVCLDSLNGRQRRALPMDLGAPSAGDQASASEPVEMPWIQPFPDRAGLAADDPGDAVAVRDTIRLAFVAALQHLDSRPRAVLILRDVLAWPAVEVAELLEMTPTAVHSMLLRGRRTIASRTGPMDARRGRGTVDEQLVAKYVDAFARHDVGTLVALLHHDAVFSMPPLPRWMRGPLAIGTWWRQELCRDKTLVRTAANGSAAFGVYEPAANGVFEAFGIQVLEMADGRITGIHTFIDAALFTRFGLPLALDPHAGQPTVVPPTVLPVDS